MVNNGKNLKILIDAPYSLFGDWSGFSLCYSIRKYLPEAEIYIKKNKILDSTHQYFNWLVRLKIKCFPTAVDIMLPSSCIMIRPIDNSNLEISEAKEDKFTPFVTYSGGCGKFVVCDWINKNEYPFPYADNFMSNDTCVNEIQVLKLWKQMNTLYPLLAGGYV